MEKKNIPIRVPVDLHLAASQRMLIESGEINFQRFMIQALEEFVRGQSTHIVSTAESQRGGTKKEQAAVDQFLAFYRSAPKEEVHIVLSHLARHREISPESNISVVEKKASGR